MIAETYIKPSGFGVGLICMFSIVVIGCAPSIRYTRNSRQTDNTSEYNNQQKKQSQDQSELKPLTAVSQNHLGTVISSCIGTPYRMGGMSRNGFDCSGFVCVVFKEVFKILLPRSSREMNNYGRKISLRKATAGDLVFFRSRRIGRINHVGIYMGEGRFAHASVTHGVIYSFLNESYYANRFAAVRRIVE